MTDSRPMTPRRMPLRIPLAMHREFSGGQAWKFIMPVFFAGSVTTATGLTVIPNDSIILLGMVLTGIAVVSMWLPGKGGVRLQTAAVMLIFVTGSGLTGLALTVNPSNTLFFWGMVLTGIGIIGMWLVGKTGPLALGIAGAFVAGTSLQATGLTIAPSDALVMPGMILVSGSVFGMWVYSSR
ncbi:MAG: hypothetical protein WD058_02885 [Dehalococcoidia bacterium]